MAQRPSVVILQGLLADYRRPLFNALADKYDVTVLHAGAPGRTDPDRFSEVIVPATKAGPFHLQFVGRIWKHVAAHDVAIIMFDLGWPAYWSTLFRNRRRGPALILHGHRYSGRGLADQARNLLMRKADALLMYGDEQVDQMVASGVDPERIVIAPNTIEVPNHEDTSALPKTRLLYVGRLQERKRLDMALRAFAELQGRIDPLIEFDIVGGGAPEAGLRAFAQDLGISSKVHFHGAVRDDGPLRDFFSSALAYVSPGPVGLAVLHSFAYGVPVLTLAEGYHGPEVHNIKDGENSLLLADEADLVAAILRVCEDRDWAARLGHAAYQHYMVRRKLDHMVSGFTAAIERCREVKARPRGTTRTRAP